MGGSLVPMRLGSIEFSITEGSFQELERSTAWRVDVAEPLEGLGKPIVRGRERDEITLQGVAYPGFSGTQDTVQRLRDAGDAGESLLLVDGALTFYGKWFIRAVSERGSAHMDTGKARRIDWTLSLVADPEDDLIPL